MSFPYVTLGSSLIDFMIQVHLAHTPIIMMCVYILAVTFVCRSVSFTGVNEKTEAYDQ